MDARTKEIVLNFIQSNYSLDYEDMVNFRVKSKEMGGRTQSITNVYEDIMEVFGFTHETTGEIFSEWVNQEAEKLEEEAAKHMYCEQSPLDSADRLQLMQAMGKTITKTPNHEQNINKNIPEDE